jgi:hypothetical protein
MIFFKKSLVEMVGRSKGKMRGKPLPHYTPSLRDDRREGY